ncbi:DUF1120 domain-containing protein [Serratia marcescens]
MKTFALKMTAVSALLFSAGSIAALPSAEIQVTGLLITPACEVDVGPGLVADYVSINHTMIDATKPTSLGLNNLGPGNGKVKVTCDAETTLSFGVTDNQLGTASVAGSQNFGLGNVNQTGKLGYYTITAQEAWVNSVPQSLFVTTDGTVTTPVGVLKLEHGKRFGWADSGSRTMSVGKSFEMRLLVEAFLARKGDMHGGVGEDTKLDGSTTLNFGFGL